MIKLLLAAALLLSVGATVFGSASSIALTVPKLGADSQRIASCDTALTTSWAADYNPSTDTEEVWTVTVDDIDGTSCAGGTLKVRLVDSSNQALGTEQIATIADQDTTREFDYSGESIPSASAASVKTVIIGP